MDNEGNIEIEDEDTNIFKWVNIMPTSMIDGTEYIAVKDFVTWQSARTTGAVGKYDSEGGQA